MDAIDAHILHLLQDNARETQADIARAVGLAPSAVLERIRKLETRGLITGYAALLDPKCRLGVPFRFGIPLEASDHRIVTGVAVQ